MYRKLFVVVLAGLLLALSLSSLMAQEAIPRGGTIVVSEGQQAPFVENFNPFTAQEDPTRWKYGTIFEPMVVYNQVTGEPVPWLATAFEWGDDLLSLTYHLREGVLWNDGEVFNADDVVFTFNLRLSNTALDPQALVEYLESVEKVDDYTVVFHLSKVYTLAAMYIGETFIAPEHIWATVEDPVTFTNPNPVATGMLSVVDQLDEQVLVLCRNENYWQLGEDGLPLPYIDCMRMPMYAGNDPANLALLSDEVDWCANFVPDLDNTYLATDPEHHFYYFWPGGGMVQFYFNTTKAPFNDVGFRQAVSMAIDYQSVVDIGMYGYAVPGSPTGLGPRYADWVNEEAVALASEMGLGVYNPEGAAALLDELGYVDADGDNWRDNPDGTPITFIVQVVNGWTDWVTSVQIISENLQAIGLNATMESPDFGIWMENLMAGTFDTSIGWGSSTITPWNAYRDLLYSPLIDADGRANGQLWHRWTSPEVDELLNQFVGTTDVAEQEAIIDRLQMIFVENVITVPLFPGPTWYEYNTLRFTGFPTADNYYTQGSAWNWQGRVLTLLQLHCVDETSCGQ